MTAHRIAALIAGAACLQGSCVTGKVENGDEKGEISVTVAISPQAVTLAAGATQQFTVTVTGSSDQSVYFSVEESGGGDIDAAGQYTAPAQAGTWHVVAASRADLSRTDRATVVVSASGDGSVTVVVTPRR